MCSDFVLKLFEISNFKFSEPVNFSEYSLRFIMNKDQEDPNDTSPVTGESTKLGGVRPDTVDITTPKPFEGDSHNYVVDETEPQQSCSGIRPPFVSARTLLSK